MPSTGQNGFAQNTVKFVVRLNSNAKETLIFEFSSLWYLQSILSSGIFLFFKAEVMFISLFFPFFKDYCATKWSVLRERFDRGLYASHADLHRLK